jgi:hypothetical protein
MLDDLVKYCQKWGLKINTSKTQAMIFENGRHTHHNFYIYGSPIETVTSFKYLGITLFKNGNWNRSQKCISQHASRALYSFFSILNNIELPIKQIIQLFDSLVGSILHFGSEIWGMHEAKDVELIHTKFLRRVLRVKRSTNLSALYGELGRMPLFVIRKINIMKYWTKVLKHQDNSIVKQTYMFLKLDAENGIDYRGKNWASQVKTILDTHGLNYIWNNQFLIDIPFQVIKQRIFDVYLQRWYTDINNSTRLQSYCIFKHNFEIEQYLDCISENKYKIALSKFRTSSHNLLIETGRYDNTVRNQRICKSCNMNTIESEYHFLLVCPNYRELRKKYFKPYYCRWPTLNKFSSIMNTNSKKLICQLAKFIYLANKVRIA